MHTLDKERAESETSWLQKLLPIIRLSERPSLGFSRKVVAIYEDTLILGRTRWFRPIDESCAAADGQGELLTRVRGRKVIPLSSVTQVTVERASLLTKSCRFRVASTERTARFRLPLTEVSHPVRALQTLLGDRILLKKRVGFHVHPLLFLLQLFLLFVLICLGANIATGSGDSTPFIVSSIIIGLVFLGILAF